MRKRGGDRRRPAYRGKRENGEGDGRNCEFGARVRHV